VAIDHAECFGGAGAAIGLVAAIAFFVAARPLPGLTGRVVKITEIGEIQATRFRR
jgi:hypothetical protein